MRRPYIRVHESKSEAMHARATSDVPSMLLPYSSCTFCVLLLSAWLIVESRALKPSQFCLRKGSNPQDPVPAQTPRRCQKSRRGRDRDIQVD